MSKRGGQVPKIAKLTGPSGTIVIDVESGILVSVSNEVDAKRIRSRSDTVAVRRSPTPRSLSSKLSRN